MDQKCIGYYNQLIPIGMTLNSSDNRPCRVITFGEWKTLGYLNNEYIGDDNGCCFRMSDSKMTYYIALGPSTSNTTSASKRAWTYAHAAERFVSSGERLL